MAIEPSPRPAAGRTRVLLITTTQCGGRAAVGGDAMGNGDVGLDHGAVSLRGYPGSTMPPISTKQRREQVPIKKVQEEKQALGQKQI